MLSGLEKRRDPCYNLAVLAEVLTADASLVVRLCFYQHTFIPLGGSFTLLVKSKRGPLCILAGLITRARLKEVPES